MGTSAPRGINVNDLTARNRVLNALRDRPKGMSKAELRSVIGGNNGAFRRLIQSMVDREEVIVEEEVRPTCGLTKVHKLPEHAGA